MKIEEGDVIQIDPEKTLLGGCFGVVTRVRHWGVEVDVPVEKNKVAPVRLQHGDYAKIGKAEWLRA